MADVASKIDWLEAFESVVKSFRAHDLEEWELHQLRSRMDAAIADMQKRLDRWEPKIMCDTASTDAQRQL